jgi:hypothetical protein
VLAAGLHQAAQGGRARRGGRVSAARAPGSLCAPCSPSLLPSASLSRAAHPAVLLAGIVHLRPSEMDAHLLTMPALILNRSSRVMPGLRGTPAGMITTSQPLSASASWSSPA